MVPRRQAGVNGRWSKMKGQSAHIFSVDVEEYFQVHAFEGLVPPEKWGAYPSRLASVTDRLLEMLDRHNATGTFFVLGWVAERYAPIVRKIAAAGHEIASHGWWHRRITDMTPEEFRQDIRSSKQALEHLISQPVMGYRAPSFSLTPGHEWAFDVLLEEGYRYDSSLFPIRRSGYGYPDSPPVPHYIQRPGGVLLEFPLSTTYWRGIRLPAAGGGYFRLLPYALTRRAFREHTNAGIPGTFYIHPWELDPQQPRIARSWLTRVRHYGGLASTESRLELLLSEFSFTSVAQCVAMRFADYAKSAVVVSTDELIAERADGVRPHVPDGDLVGGELNDRGYRSPALQ
jgi:polysaccharide deacetylase family protein (PEP-CTERM system associated)